LPSSRRGKLVVCKVPTGISQEQPRDLLNKHEVPAGRIRAGAARGGTTRKERLKGIRSSYDLIRTQWGILRGENKRGIIQGWSAVAVPLKILFVGGGYRF